MYKKPIVAIRNTGGAADKFIDGYIDHRKTVKIIGVDSPKDAVKKILESNYCIETRVDPVHKIYHVFAAKCFHLIYDIFHSDILLLFQIMVFSIPTLIVQLFQSLLCRWLCL